MTLRPQYLALSELAGYLGGGVVGSEGSKERPEMRRWSGWW
jgi:hypothetical protein